MIVNFIGQVQHVMQMSLLLLFHDLMSVGKFYEVYVTNHMFQQWNSIYCVCIGNGPSAQHYFKHSLQRLFSCEKFRTVRPRCCHSVNDGDCWWSGVAWYRGVW